VLTTSPRLAQAGQDNPSASSGQADNPSTRFARSGQADNKQ